MSEKKVVFNWKVSLEWWLGILDPLTPWGKLVYTWLSMAWTQVISHGHSN